MRLIPTILISITLAPAFAADTAPDKSDYTLFNPTPKGQMRDLSTDRPDTTESPYSVDAGHFQVEIEALSYGRDKSDGVTNTTLSSSINAKAGLTNRSDLQFVFEVYRAEKATGNGVDAEASGYGDLDIRYKFNLWGNDGGLTAGAIMPFVTLSTHSEEFGDDRHTTGGVIVPVAVELPEEFGLGVMLEVDAVRNAAEDGYAAAFVQTITVAHDLGENFGGFLELVNVAHAESETPAEAYFDAGVTYGFNDNVQLDTGVNVGLTDDSEDVRLFAGISLRH